MHNLFDDPAPSKEEEYRAYLASPAWRRRCHAALARAGWKCERCGWSKYSRRLEVHHKTYDHFREERPEDLEVVCTVCHKAADSERRGSANERTVIDRFWRRNGND